MGEALSYRWGTGQSPSPVDGQSLLPGRSLALVVLILTPLRDRCEAAAPVDGHSLLPGRSLALVVFIITQLRYRCEAAAPVDGCIIIVQMGDGAKLRPPSMAIAYYQGEGSPW